MAATGYTPISLYYSTTAATAPLAANLVNGELAINITDGKLYYKDNAGVVQIIAGKGGAGVAGGSNTQVQYNSSGSLAGSANMTFNGTTLTLANDASISGLTVGKGGTSVSSNTAFGGSALSANTTGSENTAVGYIALAQNTSGAGNSAFGRGTLYSNTTGALNTALGDNALLNNSTGNNNSAVGHSSLTSNTTGSNNVSIGETALYSNTTASNSTAVGFQAGYSNTTGTANAFFGNAAGYSVTTGNSNVCIGSGAGYNLTTGVGNTFVGGGYTGSYDPSGNKMTTGNGNSIFGNFSGNQNGLDIRTSNGYIVLSDGYGNPRLYNDTGAWYIYNAVSGGSLLQLNNTSNVNYAPVIFRNGGTQVGYINCTTTATGYNSGSDYRLKENIKPLTNALDKVALLKPCEWTWKVNGSYGDGFVAHELAEVCPQAVDGEKDAVNEDGTPKYQGVDTSFLVATLTAAIQEQQALITDLQARLTKAGL